MNTEIEREQKYDDISCRLQFNAVSSASVQLLLGWRQTGRVSGGEGERNERYDFVRSASSHLARQSAQLQSF